MAEDPEELKRNIEQTRRNVGRDVDALTEKVSPSRSSVDGSTAPAAVSTG